MKKSEAVNWYLEQIEEDINTQEELLDKKLIVEKVIHRLIHKVRSMLHLETVSVDNC